MNHLIHNTGRERLPRKPVARLLPEVKRHDHSCLDEYDCATCDTYRVPPSQMWTANECAACHERKKGTREIDALLFPKAREWKVGDEVECLAFDAWDNGCLFAHRSRIGHKGVINRFTTEQNTPIVTVGSESYWWPVRALRLIRATEDK